KHFFSVATYGGFSKAARATGTSQPALSLGLQKLEKMLGSNLVDRTERDFTLTQAGLGGLNFCQQVEGKLETIGATPGAADGTVRKRLKVGTALAIGFGPLEPLCSHLARSGENLELELTTQGTYQILNDLLAGALDAALVPDDVSDSKLDFHRLAEDKLV